MHSAFHVISVSLLTVNRNVGDETTGGGAKPLGETVKALAIKQSKLCHDA